MKKFIPAAAFCALFITGCGGSNQQAEEAATETAAPAATESAYDLADGKSVYENSCASCHAAGIMGAPKLGDAENWAPRIEQGMETLISKSIEGYTSEKGYMMPARGGNPDLTDDQVANAVAYMVEETK
ncbi:cytochrome c5 family protein [Prosthecochloris sp. ZM_2]|uniref:c-type cytochrome n=1 Tax=Prosthecochloris sp. ZM_2 TaxID=2045206 RepID=UPI000DF83EDB|nr:c-type cytochrome [Prosthecochloris sp. ZM_2]RNA65585.1 cytochrome c5 family protein [Prosthecochloris sp. ZM_2]